MKRGEGSCEREPKSPVAGHDNIPKERGSQKEIWFRDHSGGRERFSDSFSTGLGGCLRLLQDHQRSGGFATGTEPTRAFSSPVGAVDRAIQSASPNGRRSLFAPVGLHVCCVPDCLSISVCSLLIFDRCAVRQFTSLLSLAQPSKSSMEEPDRDRGAKTP